MAVLIFSLNLFVVIFCIPLFSYQHWPLAELLFLIPDAFIDSYRSHPQPLLCQPKQGSSSSPAYDWLSLPILSSSPFPAPVQAQFIFPEHRRPE